jgi:hypothetical protein
LELAALISTACTHGKRPSCRGGRALTNGNYNNFTKVNPVCSAPSPPVQAGERRLKIDRTPLCSRPSANDFTDLEEVTMFRKLSLLAVAAMSLGAAALAPTPAAAWGWHGGYGYHGGYGWHGGWYGYHRSWWGPRFVYGAPVSYAYGGCYVRQLVPTPWGPRWHLVNRCY